jgi:hypothetical protein
MESKVQVLQDSNETATLIVTGSENKHLSPTPTTHTGKDIGDIRGTLLSLSHAATSINLHITNILGFFSSSPLLLLFPSIFLSYSSYLLLSCLLLSCLVFSSLLFSCLLFSCLLFSCLLLSSLLFSSLLFFFFFFIFSHRTNLRSSFCPSSTLFLTFSPYLTFFFTLLLIFRPFFLFLSRGFVGTGCQCWRQEYVLYTSAITNARSPSLLIIVTYAPNPRSLSLPL